MAKRQQSTAVRGFSPGGILCMGWPFGKIAQQQNIRKFQVHRLEAGTTQAGFFRKNHQSKNRFRFARHTCCLEFENLLPG
jgi:hypothetical protein